MAVLKSNWPQQRRHGCLCKCWLLVIAEPASLQCQLLSSSLSLGLQIRVVVYLQAIVSWMLLLLLLMWLSLCEGLAITEGAGQVGRVEGGERRWLRLEHSCPVQVLSCPVPGSALTCERGMVTGKGVRA